jgi:hypothetical protein
MAGDPVGRSILSQPALNAATSRQGELAAGEGGMKASIGSHDRAVFPFRQRQVEAVVDAAGRGRHGEGGRQERHERIKWISMLPKSSSIRTAAAASISPRRLFFHSALMNSAPSNSGARN